ncbi:hypothetical protein Tco_0471107 [Tanacetum coccineum]
MADMVEANQALEERLDKHGSRLYKLENLNIPHQVSKAVDEIVIDAVDWAIQAPLRDRFRDLPEADMKEILHHRPSGTSRTSGAFGSSQVTPPPPPPSTNQSDQSQSTAAPSSSKIAASAEYTAWTTTNTRRKPCVSSIPKELHMDDDTTPDEQVQSSSDEGIGHDHIPTVNLRQNWWKPLTEDRPATPETAWSIPSSGLPVPVNNWASALASTYAPPLKNSLLVQTSDMAIFMDWFCKEQGITELKQQDMEGPAYEIVKVFHRNVIHLRILQQMVPDQIWIEEECKYDIAAMYGISHWWFQRQRFYIDRHTSEGDLIDSPRAVTFRDKYGVQMIMRFNEIHKFSDGTLQQIDEALDYRVKEFKVNRMNLGLNIRFWIRTDVDRSKEFMFSIQKWLRTRRIFRNLESFVGGGIREGDYRLLMRTE